MKRQKIRKLAVTVMRHSSVVGLCAGVLFLALSLSPSLVPRPFVLQGVVSGIALALGYAVGAATAWLWQFMEFPEARGRVRTVLVGMAAGLVGGTLYYFLDQATLWQNSIRERMEMPLIEDDIQFAVVTIAVGIALVLIVFCAMLRAACVFAARKFHNVVPRRFAYVIGGFVFALVFVSTVNGVLVSRLITAVDQSYAKVDSLTLDGIDPPVEVVRSGSPASLVAFNDLGKAGKEFVVGGPRANDLELFSGTTALDPVRVYVGLSAGESMHEQAALALAELVRTDAFDRSVLVIATPTGTGWIDAGAIDTLEYLHNGDTAVVGVQYSYLSSPVTLILDPDRARESARVVFETIYTYWKALDPADRPELYLYGLSLGSLGSEDSTSLYALLDDPIDGAFWAGPPFANTIWPEVLRGRNEGTPAWAPEFDDGSLIRFLGQDNTRHTAYSPWGSLKIVYLLYPSDAIVFFSPDLWYAEPEWLRGERGPDISPYLTWYPFVTFWQVGLDMLVTTKVPFGYGHNYSAANYLEGWIELMSPPWWSEDDSRRLLELL